MVNQAQQAKKPNFINKSVAYFSDVRSEMGKVTWPTREDLKSHTTVVLMFLALLAVVVGTLDQIFQRFVLILYSLT
ncbi:MAG: preprotein translocase subunit SecE [Candidatus Hydrogenedentota bacterium]